VHDIINAIFNVQKQANISRKLEGKKEIETYAIISKLTEPKCFQNKLFLPGLQSTHALTYHKKKQIK